MRLTASQLRRIIREEVSKVARGRRSLREAAPLPAYARSATLGDIKNQVCDIVGYGEPEDYDSTARIVNKYLKVASTVSKSQRPDRGMGGLVAEMDPEQIENELFDDLKFSMWAEASRVSDQDIASVARQIVVAFGLESGHDIEDY